MLRSGQEGQRFESLDRLARSARLLGDEAERKARLPAIRNQAILALTLPDIRPGPPYPGIDWKTGRGSGYDRTSGLAAFLNAREVWIYRPGGEGAPIRLPGANESSGVNIGHVSFSPGGKSASVLYVMNSDERIIHVWDLPGRERLGVLSTRFDRAIFQPDGRRLIYTPADGGVAFWDLATRRESRRITLDFRPGALAIDGEGRRLAVGSHFEAGPKVVIIEVDSGRVLSTWDKGVGTGFLTWSDDGRMLAMGGTNVEPRGHVWDVRRGERITTLEGHSLMTVGASFVPGSYRLWTSSWDDSSRLWDAVSGDQLLELPGFGFQSTSSDGRHAQVATTGGMSWSELATGVECRVLHPGLLGNRLDDRGTWVGGSAEFAADGRLLATTDWQGVRLWDAETGAEPTLLDTGPGQAVRFEPGGGAMYTSSNRGLFRWPIRPGAGLDGGVNLGPPALICESPARGLGPLAWLPDRRTLALLDNPEAQVQIVDTSHPNPYAARSRTFGSLNNRRLMDVAVSPDGRWMAAGGWKEAGVTLWNVREGRLDRIIASPQASREQSVVYYAQFSPDGRWLISPAGHGSSGRQTYLFWKAGSWDLGFQIDTERQATVGAVIPFTGDGRIMALRIAPDQILLADPADGREIARLTTPRAVQPYPLAFSPDGTKLVASTMDKRLLIWDLPRSASGWPRRGSTGTGRPSPSRGRPRPRSRGQSGSRAPRSTSGPGGRLIGSGSTGGWPPIPATSTP